MQLDKLLRIARWEVTKGTGSLDRRTLGFAGLVVLLVVLAGPLAALTGVGLEDGLYRVGVDEDSPYHAVAISDDSFVVVESADRGDLGGSVELLVDERGVQSADSAKGDAARDAFRTAIRQYNEQQLQREPNQTAAFPVDVTLEFREQGGIGQIIGTETGGGSPDDDDGGDGSSGGNSDDSSGDSDGGDGSGWGAPTTAWATVTVVTAPAGGVPVTMAVASEATPMTVGRGWPAGGCSRTALW